MSNLTSRERVNTALDHHVPDRIPIDVGGSRVTGISALAYTRLLDYLGIEEKVKVYDIKQQLASVSLEINERLGSDVAQLTRLGPTTGMPFFKIDTWQEGSMTDGTPCLVPEGYEPVFREDGSAEIFYEGKLIARRPAGGLYFDVVSVPLKNAKTQEDIDAFIWPDPWSQRERSFLKSEVERLYYQTDKAIFGGLPAYDSSFFEIGQTMFGFENLLMNFLLKPDMMHYWLDKLLEHHLQSLDEFLSIAGPYISAIQLSDDFGAQESLLISPEVFRSFIKPRMAKWISYAKKKTDSKIFLHCDGAIGDILDDLVEIGVEILNPIQTSAKGMDPQYLKKRYGDRLVFWGGGVETQTTLPQGSIEDIRKEVKERIRTLSPGGGYVFAAIHNIQSDVSPEKILTVFDTAQEEGLYT
jgi:uroporphyrinogen decarboxylase